MSGSQSRRIWLKGYKISPSVAPLVGCCLANWNVAGLILGQVRAPGWVECSVPGRLGHLWKLTCRCFAVTSMSRSLSLSPSPFL